MMQFVFLLLLSLISALLFFPLLRATNFCNSVQSAWCMLLEFQINISYSSFYWTLKSKWLLCEQRGKLWFSVKTLLRHRKFVSASSLSCCYYRHVWINRNPSAHWWTHIFWGAVTFSPQTSGACGKLCSLKAAKAHKYWINNFIRSFQKTVLHM